MAVIEVRDLRYRYEWQDSYAIEDVDLSIGKGEFVLVTGPSGCGKSTLFRCINGLIPSVYGGEYSGKVNVLGLDPSEVPPYVVSQYVGTVFQNPDNQLFAMTVEDDVAFALENLGLPREEIVERVEEAISMVGIEELRRRSTLELSGGQKQKVAIASALALRPKILLLDEPTSSLDPLSAKSLIETLVRLRDENGVTIVIAEHRIEMIAPHADKMVVMDRGRMVDVGRTEEVIERAMRLRYPIGVPKISRMSAMLYERLNLRPKVCLTIEDFSRVVDDLRGWI